MSNALFLEKLNIYRSLYGLEITKTILAQKIKFQFEIVNQKQKVEKYLTQLRDARTQQACMLVEARAAKQYWKYFEASLKYQELWSGRCAHRPDIPNHLLDIGHHYISDAIQRIFEQIDMPSEFGFFHKARSKDAHPLVYDFVEWVRPILVDKVVY